MTNQDGFIRRILDLPLFHAAWVLWLLLLVSVASVGIMLERAMFFRLRRVNVDAVRRELGAALQNKATCARRAARSCQMSPRHW